MYFPVYNTVYPKFCQGYEKDVCQWNETLYLKTVIIQWNAWKKKKDLFLLANKLIEKIPDPRNAKGH